ncbi:hypothetical protein TSUD_265420 [Trifolium subterraneum]|uniref:Uncharacterized protein n=1 Tax=Trifolium subterraneum TaxID=3900 RepID=A0A2Z6N690_TRISU|nr:hypothetical protein TSUD_265420 [Trifolium subterraneum]
MFNEFMPQIESEESSFWSLNVLLRSLRNAKDELIEMTSSSVYGASVKQDHEDSVEDVIQVSEMLKECYSEHFTDSCPDNLQIACGVAERMLRARLELFKENCMDIGMPIILEYTDTLGATNRRFWGTMDIKLEDPFYKPVMKRLIQLSLDRSMADSRETFLQLKCKPAGEEEASGALLEESLEGYYNPELEELMKMIEQNAMSFNKSYGKMKASIVQTDDPFSENYQLESLILGRLMMLGKLTMFGSVTKFKITPYGKMRTEDGPFRFLRICLWGMTKQAV